MSDIDVSTADCTELKKLIVEHPELPLIICAEATDYDNGMTNCTMVTMCSVVVTTIYQYKDQTFYEDEMQDYIEEHDIDTNLPEIPHTEAIVVYVAP